MKSKDIVPGRYYRVRMEGGGDDLVRAEEVEALDTKWGATVRRLRCTRFLVGGTIVAWFSVREVLREEEPSEGHLTVFKMVEDLGPLNRKAL